MSKSLASRLWFAILYADNTQHILAIEKAEKLPSVIMFHDKDIHDDGSPVKAHWHLAFKFNQQYYLSKLLKDLNLNAEENGHLFMTLKEIKDDTKGKIKSFNDYIEYETHINEDDKYFYNQLEFKGGLREYAINYISDKQIEPEDIKLEIVEYLEHCYSDQILNFRLMTFGQIWLHLYNRYGKRGVRYWQFLLPIIKDYRND